VCVNGDGFDLLQTGFRRLAADAVAVMNRLKRLMDAGQRVYYVVGNHDIALEHFLADWIFTGIAPFLNVRSGDQRIRVEHGHLYDPWYSIHPMSYDLGCRASSLVLFAVPDVYASFARLGARRERLWHARSAEGERGSPYHRAASLVLERGFDTVIFGHTHRAEDLSLPEGRYLNGGNWMRDSTYIAIDHGSATLERW
jgi:UDP-2,3-diacylglucosamine pyrophosphatase LpxH